MNMANVTVDFNYLAKDGKKLFAGRANGKMAYEKFNVDAFRPNTEDVLYFKIPDDVVVSSSYFLGLLEVILPKFKAPSDLFKQVKVNDKDYSEGEFTELERAVKRGLHRNVPFFNNEL